MVLKATQVDGVFTADPKKDPSAKMYKSLTFDEAIQKKLKILDATAFTLCRDQGMPIRVFNLHKPGALKRIVLGEGHARSRLTEKKRIQKAPDLHQRVRSFFLDR